MPELSFNPEMLVLARESRGCTQSSLAQKAWLGRPLLSKYESGIVTPPQKSVCRLANVLGYPDKFFYQQDRIYGLGVSFLFHRKRQSMPIREQRRVQAIVNILRMQIKRLLRSIEIESEHLFQPMDVDEHGGAENVARHLRAMWQIPMGPVRNLVAVIENAGGLVIRYPFENRKIDGISLWGKFLPPLFFINSDMPGDRTRFTLSHELGHIIMHRSPTEDMEGEADRFASEFLMPAREIAPYLTEMTLEKSARLKPTWKVSMQALIRRARDLDKISHNRYRRLCTQIGRAGYRTHEPLEIPIEKPMLMKQAISIHLQEHNHTVDDLCEMALIGRQEFCEQYAPDLRARLQVVKPLPH